MAIDPKIPTIILDSDEITDLIKSCKDTSGSISKDFFDWYLGESPFFQNEAIIIVNMEGKGHYLENEKLCFHYNAKNINDAKVTILDYYTRKHWAGFHYKRNDNISISDIKLEFEYLHEKKFRPITNLYSAEPNTKERIHEQVIKEAKTQLRNPYSVASDKSIKGNAVKTMLHRYNLDLCNLSIYILYSLMFYFHKYRDHAELLTPSENTVSNTKKINSTYKYTGYVNLNKLSPTYIIKKDPNAPVREYSRHIEAWSVRGHYRRTSKGLIWIEQHIKGKGELEKRVYGTEEESNIPLIPKIFPVEITVTEAKKTIAKPVVIPQEDKIAPAPIPAFKKQGLIKGLITVFKKLFRK